MLLYEFLFVNLSASSLVLFLKEWKWEQLKFFYVEVHQEQYNYITVQNVLQINKGEGIVRPPVRR